MLKIDHVALVTSNVMTTAWQLQQAGLPSYDGGFGMVHENDEMQAGTAHRGVPLGNDQYIEIEQFIDRRQIETVEDEVVRYTLGLRDRVATDGPILLGFWVITDDFDARLKGIGVEQMHQRVRPDGFVTKGRTTPRSMDAISRGLPPFFEFTIPLEEHPARVPVERLVEPTGIAWLEVGGDQDEMEEWLGEGAGELPLRHVGGERGIRAMGVGLESGENVEIRPNAGEVIVRQS